MEYIKLRQNGKSVEITDHEKKALDRKLMRVRWELESPDVVVTDHVGYRNFLNLWRKNKIL